MLLHFRMGFLLYWAKKGSKQSERVLNELESKAIHLNWRDQHTLSSPHIPVMEKTTGAKNVEYRHMLRVWHLPGLQHCWRALHKVSCRDPSLSSLFRKISVWLGPLNYYLIPPYFFECNSDQIVRIWVFPELE